MAINVDVDANDLKFLFKNLSRIGKIGDEEDFFFFFPTIDRCENKLTREEAVLNERGKSWQFFFLS